MKTVILAEFRSFIIIVKFNGVTVLKCEWREYEPYF